MVVQEEMVGEEELHEESGFEGGEEGRGESGSGYGTFASEEGGGGERRR